MVKFVLDADGEIKLAKAGVIKQLAESAACIMPKQVYEEILKGKEKLYEDAFVTEKLATEKKLRIVALRPEHDPENLGLGERSALAAYKKHKASAIISDDARFISELEKKNMRFMIPTNAIVWLVKQKKLSKKDGKNALEKIRNIVRDTAYTRAKKTLGGK